MRPAASEGVLVVYDDSGPFAWLGELYATGAGTMASHFGRWSAMPVSAYAAGRMRGAAAVIYVGSTYDQPLPAAFTDDVLADAAPVVWIGDNVWELARRAPDFEQRYGFLPDRLVSGPFHTVIYRDMRLPRVTDDSAEITSYARLDPIKARVLGWIVGDDGKMLPWALRSGRFTYFGENPLTFVTPGDRALAFYDLMFDVLAPATKERHRALVRIEDVHPRSSPAALRAIADRLSARKVPFAIALIPVFEDPNGAMSGDLERRVRLRDAPDVVEALEYMIAHGGSIVLHGYTHQLGAERNPYSGVSGADFEFYRAHVGDDAKAVVLDGPVADDSAEWARARVERGLEEIAAAGLPRPVAFEYPHYVGSPVDSRAIAKVVGVAFQRELLFSGALAGGHEDTSRSLSLSFPFTVDDVYGWRVVPENIGNYVPPHVSRENAQSPPGERAVAGRDHPARARPPRRARRRRRVLLSSDLRSERPRSDRRRDPGRGIFLRHRLVRRGRLSGRSRSAVA
jgi:uncharacterized protein YdaL